MLPEVLSSSTIIAGFVEPILAQPSHLRHFPQVANSCEWIGYQCEKCRVGRNDQAFDLGFPLGKVRKSKGVVLIVACLIELSVGRLGNTPGHTCACCVSLLGAHRRNARAFQKRSWIRTHPER